MEKRRFLAILMTVFMVITMLPTMAFAAEVPTGELDGKLAVKGLAAVDEELSADYTKVKPEGMTDDGVTVQWSREVSETELVEIGTEKTYKVTQEDLGYKLVLTITGKEEMGITGTLTAKTKEVLQTKEEAQTREEQDKAAEEAAAAEETVGEETAEQAEENTEAEQTTEEIPEAQPDGTQPEVTEEASEEQTEETEQSDEQVVYDETPEDTSEETVEEIPEAQPEETQTEEAEQTTEEIPEAQPDGTIEGQTPELTYTAEGKSDEENNVLDFGTAEEGLLTDVEAKYVAVKNTGTGALNFTEISPEHFMVQDITDPLQAGEETSLWIQPREGLAAGEYEDTITYTSEEGAEVSFTAKIKVESTELEPVDNPEEEPAEEPTETPAAEPTETPAAEPTETPAAEPTETPAEPTETPAEPTATPEEPTEEPVREASLDVQELDFGEATVGYGELEAKTVTVTNTGNTELTLLNPETSGTFKAGALSAETLAAGESASFTIVPETGLDAGVYQEKISVWETENTEEALGTVTVNFTVKEEKAVYKLTASPEAVDFGSAEEGYEQAPEAQTITVTNVGNKELTLSQPLAENFKAGALSAAVIAPGESSTFSVQPGMKLKAGTYKEVLNIPYGDGLSVQVTLSFKVTEKKAETIKLTGIQKPSDITGLKNGTEKSAKALGLPSTVVIKTSKDKMKAKVKWDVQGAEYDQSSKDAQTFKVKGTVTLPDGIVNPDNISLITSVTVTVDAGHVAKIADASDNKITGIQAEGYTTQSKITFTAVGAGMDNENPGKGDVRYLPLNWKVINTNSWDNAPYTATFGITKAGTYTLSVVFNRQQFDGSNWVNTSEQDTKSVEFKIGNPQNVTPTVTPANNQKSAVKTGDNTPITPFVIVLVIAVGAIAGVIIYKKKNK